MKAIIEFLRQHNNFLLLTHRRPDGDTLGSAVALCAGLRTLGKTSYLWRNPEVTGRYMPLSEPYFAPEGFIHETAVAVDIASASQLGESWDGSVGLRIDHHPDTVPYADIEYSDPSAAACGEIIYDLLAAMNVALSEEMAAALYIAVTTDTGCFRYTNTTATTHRIAANLIEAGADAHALDRISFSKTRGRLAAEGCILARMEFLSGGKVAVASLTLTEKEAIGATEDDLDSISSITQSIEGVCAGFMLREEADEWRVSCRTAAPYAANRICALLDGGGHVRAAGASIKQPLTDAQARMRVLDALRTAYPDLRGC